MLGITATAMLTQLGLPVKLIIYDNGSLGFVAMEMKAAGYLDTGTDLQNPQFLPSRKRIWNGQRKIYERSSNKTYVGFYPCS